MKHLLLFLLGIHTVLVMGCMTPSSLKNLNRYHSNISGKKFAVVHHFKESFSIIYAPGYSYPLSTPDVTGFVSEQVALHNGDGVLNLYVDSENSMLGSLIIGLLTTTGFLLISNHELESQGDRMISGVVVLFLAPFIAAGFPLGVRTFTLEGDIIKYKE